MTRFCKNPYRSFFPALLLVTSSLAVPPPQLPPGKQWREAPKTDAAHPAPYTEFTLAGKFIKWPQADVTVRPTLALDCMLEERSHGTKGTFLQGNLFVGTVLKIDYVEPEQIEGISYFQKVSVRYRFDDEKMRKGEWPPGKDKNSVSIPEDNLKNLLRAHTVLIMVDEDQGGEVSMQFDIPDSAKVGETCGVESHKK